MNTEAVATAKGKALLARMNAERAPGSPEWSLRVWENFGWHCALHNGSVHLYEVGWDGENPPRYHVLIGDIPKDGYPGGGGTWEKWASAGEFRVLIQYRVAEADWSIRCDDFRANTVARGADPSLADVIQVAEEWLAERVASAETKA